jgi:hypothetical protein
MEGLYAGNAGASPGMAMEGLNAGNAGAIPDMAMEGPNADCRHPRQPHA